ncbi:hypothetical protein D3C81_1755130 [compost metagenome]
MAEHQPRVGKRRVAGHVITRAVQPNAIGIRRGVPAKLRAVDHNRFRVLRLFLANHPHIAGGRVTRQAIGPATGKLGGDRFAVLPCGKRQQCAIPAFRRSVEHRCGEIVAREQRGGLAVFQIDRDWIATLLRGDGGRRCRIHQPFQLVKHPHPFLRAVSIF